MRRKNGEETESGGDDLLHFEPREDRGNLLLMRKLTQEVVAYCIIDVECGLNTELQS